MSKSIASNGWSMTLAGVVAGASLMTGGANAATYDWTFTGTPAPEAMVANGSGTFVETSGAITAFGGTFDGNSISGVLAPETFYNNDNLYPLTSGGVAFSLATPLDGASEVSFSTWNSGGEIWNSNADTVYGYGTFTAQASGVPEPSTWALLGLGAAGLLGVRRRRKAALAAA